MGSGLENMMIDRRNFLRDSALAIASIPFARFALAGDMDKTSFEKLEEILGLHIEVKDWKPVDVTDAVRDALGGKEWEFERTVGAYPHDKWSVQRSFRTGDKEIILPQDKFGRIFLCSAQHKKIYPLDFGDGIKTKYTWTRFPLYYIEGANTEVAENGVVTYGLYEEKRETPNTVIMANIHTGKKLVFREKEYTPKGIVNDFGLSGIGNRLLIDPYPHYVVLDTSNFNIVDSGESGAFLITYDGKSILHHKPPTYSLRNVDTKKSIVLTGQDLEKVGWKVSKNSEYWGCGRSMYPAFDLEVIVLPDRSRFIIDHPIEADQIIGIDNDGTVHALSGVYRYKDGMYHWATEGKPRPEGLRIIKR